MIKPIRLQRSRKKGSRLVSPNGLPVVCVTRGTKFGNPFRIGGHFKMGGLADSGIDRFMAYTEAYEPSPGFTTIRTKEESVEWFRKYRTKYPLSVSEIADLRGKNLACWCKPGEACHADVLLELANKEVQS